MSKESIAMALREHRKKSGLTVAEIAKAVGKSTKTVYAWEACNGQPDGDTFVALSKLYGIDSFKVFLAGEEPDRRLWSTPLVDAYEQASNDTQHAVCAVLNIPHVVPMSKERMDRLREKTVEVIANHEFNLNNRKDGA